MPSRNGKTKHASMYDFRDLDLMLTIEERGDQDGWAETGDLASTLGFGDVLLPISRRLAWMRKYGMLDFDSRHHVWRLTEGGLRVIDARLKAAQAKTLEKLPDEALVDVMANVITHRHLASPMVATMLRREFLFGTQRRR